MKDSLLLFTMGLAESDTPIETDVTLVVGGFLISGYVTVEKNT